MHVLCNVFSEGLLCVLFDDVYMYVNVAEVVSAVGYVLDVR